MIVFTLTNTRSGQVYVGTTQGCPEQRWAQFCAAADEGLESDLYSDIRHCGAAAFELSEWAVAEDLADLRQLAEEAIAENDALSLQGVRTRPERGRAAPVKSRPQAAKTKPVAAPGPTSASSSRSKPADAATSARNKLPNGRVGSSERERKVREGIEQERQARLAQEKARQQAQADEMAAIMARIDGRGRR